MRHESNALLIAERDGAWEAWVARLRACADVLHVIRQRPEEGALAFASRVRSEVSRLDGDITDAAFVGSATWGAEVLSARALVLRAVTAKLSASGTLTLDAPGRARHAMEALAEMAREQLQSSGVSVVAASLDAWPMAA